MNQRSITFGAVGDITLGDHPLTVGFGAFSRFKGEDGIFPFLKTLNVLREADLLFGNLECAHSWVGLRPGDYKSVQMRGDPRHIQALVAAGFKVVNVANNHSMQHGTEAFLDSVHNLESANIRCCGIAANESATSARPVTVEMNGVKVGFLGYSLRPRQYFEHVPLYAEGEPEAMVQDVQTLRDRVDSVVVSVHWGDEFIQRPSPDEKTLARRLVDVGADLIIGHHPHVLRGFERRGRGCIVYSLGNFVSDMIWDDALRTSVIFECTITKSGISDINFVPTFANADFQPEAQKGSNGDAIRGRLRQLSEEIERRDSKKANVTDEIYYEDAEIVHRQIRAKSHRFFLCRFWKYPARILFQQIGTYVKNRLHERTVLR